MSTQDMAAQLAELRRNFVAAGLELNTALGRGLTDAALIVERDYKIRLTKGGHVASGLLRASASHRLIDVGRYKAAQVGPAAEYGKEVELGSAPHTVPIDDLIKWAKRKGLDEDAAYAIQKHIEKYGTMPHPALLPALLSNKVAIFNAIAAPMKAQLRKRRAKNAT
jgi:hypothetical protein